MELCKYHKFIISHKKIISIGSTIIQLKCFQYVLYSGKSVDFNVSFFLDFLIPAAEIHFAAVKQ